MRVTYDQTVDDLIHFNQFHWRNSPAMRRMYRWNFLGAPFAGFIAAYVMRGESSTLAASTAIGATAGYCLFLIWSTRWSLKWAVRKMTTEGHGKGLLGQHDIEIRSDGIHERTDVNDSRQSWAAVERVAESDRYIFIYIGPMLAHIIPKAAFASAEEAASFFSQARSFHLGT
jgi:hypothetical protein